MAATTMIVMTTLKFFVKTILTKKLWFVKREISLSVEKNVPHLASMDFYPDSMICEGARREFMHLRD